MAVLAQRRRGWLVVAVITLLIVYGCPTSL